ncbi:hypothetical protein [Mesorhizobium sp. B2-8-9]|uniref:hypothetical protein n=1 Tax=Mesorhizobium sp. B2-8-9 TaxID=2589899 RepID=UPI00112AABA3|nr:hypothetical protein [Mesorhizobium sp. B2-8-9]TPI80419.1 hypothetical protein FJ423_12045 [Mesorhizobium sp. B2-8-9]
MFELWEQESVSVLFFADELRDLGTRRIECESDGGEIIRALETLAAEILVTCAKLNEHRGVVRRGSEPSKVA